MKSLHKDKYNVNGAENITIQRGFILDEATK